MSDLDAYDDNPDVYSAADDDIFDRADRYRKAQKENPDE